VPEVVGAAAFGYVPHMRGDHLFGNGGADLFLPDPDETASQGVTGRTRSTPATERDNLIGGPGKMDRARIDRGLDHVTYMDELL
jgi:hypothetical protein